MAAYVVAIDNGSQSTKVSIVDADGRVHASARVGLRPYLHPAPGHVVHPGDDVWESIASACRLALDRFTGDASEIVAVGLCTIRFCRAILDADGQLAEPMLSWMDSRVGRPFEPSDAQATYVTTSSGYITRRLTGAFSDAAANYQGVWPIDQNTWRWSDDPQAYRDTGMTRAMLFDLVDPGSPLGMVTAEAAAATGIPEGIVVYATANDKAVEALGSGLRGESELVLSLGTYVSSMTIGDGSASADAFWVNFGSRPGQYLYESEGIRRGMWTVSWFRSLLQAEANDAEQEDALGDRLYSLEERLNEGAASVPPGSGGLMTVLDWLAPANAQYRRGALLGFDGSQGRFHIYRSILEGLAFTMADHAAAMETALERRFDSVILSGGGARSQLIATIIADVFGLVVRRAETDDAAGMGAAICAAVGSGMHPSWDEAITRMVRYAPPVEPSQNRAAAYSRLHRVHTGLRARTDGLFEWMTTELQSREEPAPD
ncbi:FGGY-family carbohydrate kinase [Parafrigoribacterium soli]|uniref:FGGY-family carbohydrate kinase n=1 Tax=Parafrigoribacterium soli TaxID=3144663 RepID=UPI0032EBE760